MKKFLVLALGLAISRSRRWLSSPRLRLPSRPTPRRPLRPPRPEGCRRAKTDSTTTKSTKKSHKKSHQEDDDRGQAGGRPQAVRLRFRLRAGSRIFAARRISGAPFCFSAVGRLLICSDRDDAVQSARPRDAPLVREPPRGPRAARRSRPGRALRAGGSSRAPRRCTRSRWPRTSHRSASTRGPRRRIGRDRDRAERLVAGAVRDRRRRPHPRRAPDGYAASRRRPRPHRATRRAPAPRASSGSSRRRRRASATPFSSPSRRRSTPAAGCPSRTRRRCGSPTTRRSARRRSSSPSWAPPATRRAPAGASYRFQMPQRIPAYLMAIAAGDIGFAPLGPRTRRVRRALRRRARPPRSSPTPRR